MADFSASGLGSDFPTLSLDAVRTGGDPRVLAWLREAVQEGDRLNRADPFYERMEDGMNYVAAIQRRNADSAGSGGPSDLPGLQINKCRTATQAHVSALTDLRALAAYRATNPAFAIQADLINKLTIADWITSKQDLALGDTIKYALAAGCGDMAVEWDPNCNFYGGIRFSARDSRDTLALRPPTHFKSVHDWEGCIIREAHTINALMGLFPEHKPYFQPTSDSLLSTLMGRIRRWTGGLRSPAASGDTLAGLDAPALSSRTRSGDCLLYRAFLTDRSRNLTTKPIPMGRPGASWAYVVPPGGYMYPFKRLIVATPEAILYDGPNTYWHGTYPIARLQLWTLPWLFFGQGLMNDLLPIQDAINDTAKDILLAQKQWMNPAVAYNRNAVGESFMRTFDARRPGAKVKLNYEGVEKGFKKLDGPPPQMIAQAVQMLQLLIGLFDDLSGTPNMQELLALRQLPSADTLQRYWEALTPEIRQEGRQVESFLGDVGEQMKVSRFQFESNARRVAILGPAGEALEDFDFDPKQLVPALTQGDPGYHPDLDASKSRDERAKAFSKMIVFAVAPNSLLNINGTESKMMKFQLSRAGLYDPWSLAEALEIPNYGAPPKIPLPPISEEKAAAEIQDLLVTIQSGNPADPMSMQAAQQAAVTLQSKYLPDPATGRWLEIREPLTVTERLMAQQMLGLGMSENPAGRKASGQAPPKTEQKSDGRTTTTESSHEAGQGPGS